MGNEQNIKTTRDSQSAVVVVRCKYYYLKQRDEFQDGDEFQNYSWTKTYYPIPKEWYGDEKHKHLSYRTRVRRSI